MTENERGGVFKKRLSLKWEAPCNGGVSLESYTIN